jgi:polysaccharide biosynthesis/export protein
MSRIQRGTFIRVVVYLVSCTGFASCSTAPPADLALTHVPVIGAAKPDQTGEASMAPYHLKSGDELDVRFADAPQYDQTTKVRPDGKVNLNVIGPVAVGGLTPEALQEAVRERYQGLAGSEQKREYLIHANDELEIKFPYHPQFTDQMRVRPDGKIQLQLVGAVQAEGLSPEELDLELKHRYAQFLKNPELTVIVRAATSQAVRTADGIGRGGLAGLQPVVSLRSFQTPEVFVTGEVAHAGTLPYAPGMTLLQALAAAGGNMPSGDVTKLVVLRRSASDTADVLHPQLSKTFRAAPTRDFELQPFDVILLPPTRAQKVAESLDKYVYKIIAPLKNSAFSYVLTNSNNRLY